MATAKEKAWSISRLQCYEQCPRKYNHLYIAKDVADDFTGEAAQYGKEVHKACEEYVSIGKPLGKRFEKFKPMLDKIVAAKGETLTELNLTLNENLERTGWFDSDAYIRAILDIVKMRKHKAWIGDYKTGKMKDDYDQLTLNAAMLFVYFPDLKEIVSSYIWLKDGKITKERYTRGELESIWTELLPRAKRIELSVDSGKWPARTSGLCGYCPAKKQNKCPYG